MTAEAVSLPQTGELAPPFTLPSTEGHPISLEDYRGKQAVVLYFYPRDDTPGCTVEACAFRDLSAVFGERGAAIVGVSADSIKSHLRFRQKFDLNFPLLSDRDHVVAEQYGVWQRKKFMGREYMGIARTTFVVDRQGRIAAVYPNVKVDGHAREVLDALR